MQQHIKSHDCGMTLTELILSTILVGIVMIGAISVDFAVRSARRNTTENTGLAIRTYTMINHIIDNARLASGYVDNPGIWQHPINQHNFCFRQDVLTTPSDYSDDIWVCYWRSDENIYTCDRTIPAGPGPCTTADERIGSVANNAGVYAFFPLVTLDEAGRLISFEIELTGRFNPNEPYHPLHNPELTLRSAVVPPHSI